MLTKQVLKEYAKQRRAFVSPYHSPIQGRAKECLQLAKEAVWNGHNWQDFDNNGVALSDDGLWRLSIKPDDTSDIEDLFGDTYNVEVNADSVPGGRRTIEAQHKAALAKVERDGVWGYVLEHRCAVCGSWQHVDSCWGFECEVPDYEIITAQYQAHG